MRTKAILAALALTTVATAMPAAAQPNTGWQAGSSWNRDTFWRGAPDNLQQRIDWLQQRIDRGSQDGSLDRREARRARMQLDSLRRDAAALDARLDDLSRNLRWSRNDRPGWGRPGGGGAYNYGDRDQYATDYDASRYYRDDARYQERRLSSNDEVYRGSDGRYYCKRNDGTTGLVIGAVGGAVLGNVIDGGRNRVAGTLIGGALGALVGKSVDQNNSDVRCR
ncbi:MAG: glycine zipper 2TM domain-containing protein [Novosphingobium sp.]